MIYYPDNAHILGIILRRNGSVFPAALNWALSNAVFAAVAHSAVKYLPRLLDSDEFGQQMDGVPAIWSGYTAVLGFLVVFRNNQAYSRFWEGATLVNQTRGEWFNAVSSLIAFCNTSEEMKDNVEHFQALMIRLASLLHCSALQEVCEIEDSSLEVFGTNGIGEESLAFLEIAHDRVEIIIQWLQRLILSAHSRNILIAPSPILSRSFQELSRGVVNLNNVRKIRDVPFPFPYNQVLILMLAVHWLITPLLAAFHIANVWWACSTCFFVTGGLWCLVYIAREIDQPFGEDPNDLPMVEMQRSFNKSLASLMEPLAQKVPAFVYDSRARLKLTARYEAPPDTTPTRKRTSGQLDSAQVQAMVEFEQSFARQITPLSDAFSSVSKTSTENSESLIFFKGDCSSDGMGRALQDVIQEHLASIIEDEQPKEFAETPPNGAYPHHQELTPRNDIFEKRRLELAQSCDPHQGPGQSEGEGTSEGWFHPQMHPSTNPDGMWALMNIRASAANSCEAVKV